MMSVENLASYLPDLVLRRFAANPTPLRRPEMDRFPAAVLFADIQGFMPLVERFMHRGPIGNEDLTDLLNAYFGQLIEILTAHGGDIVKMAGDALVAIWPVSPEEDLAAVTWRAT